MVDRPRDMLGRPPWDHVHFEGEHCAKHGCLPTVMDETHVMKVEDVERISRLLKKKNTQFGKSE